MIPRTLSDKISGLFTKFPVVALLGPRQSGKTTLLRHLYPDIPYLSLENPDVRRFAVEDPRRFLATHGHPCIIDEAQHAPELFSYLQQVVDETDRPGLYLISGSQHFLLSERVSQTLAGRVAVLNLLPLSLEELGEDGPPDADAAMLRGFYPRLYGNAIDPSDFYPSYIATYVERDVRLVKNITDLSAFQRFMRLCAGRAGGLLNLSQLGNDCGITHNTAAAWLSVLEAGFIAFPLPPFHANYNKRVIKSPKLYFYDTGLACSLLGIENTRQLATHPMRGHLFENLIVSELFKYRLHRGKRPNCYFWRDKTGNEVDCIIEQAGRVVPVEIKAGQTINADFLKGLAVFNAIRGETGGYVVYGGEPEQRRAEATILRWRDCTRIFADTQ